MSRNPGGAGFAEWLVGVTARGRGTGEAAAGAMAGNIEESGLDARTHALVQFAAVVAQGDPGTAYDPPITRALDQGVMLDEVAGVLVALLPTVGTVRISVAAEAVHAAIGRVTADRS